MNDEPNPLSLEQTSTGWVVNLRWKVQRSGSEDTREDVIGMFESRNLQEAVNYYTAARDLLRSFGKAFSSYIYSNA